MVSLDYACQVVAVNCARQCASCILIQYACRGSCSCNTYKHGIRSELLEKVCPSRCSLWVVDVVTAGNSVV